MMTAHYAETAGPSLVKIWNLALPSSKLSTQEKKTHLSQSGKFPMTDFLFFFAGLKWKSKVQRLSLRGDEEDEGV